MKVKVVKVQGKYLVLRWTCPETGKPKQKSAKTNTRRIAERMAAKLEEKLKAGTYFEPTKMTWEEFREHFETERFPNLRPGSGRCYCSTFNRVQQVLNPNRLSELNSMSVSKFQNKLREMGCSESTVAKHLRHLKAALRWGKSMGMLNRVPEFHFPKGGKHQRLMKGRPITDKEFERMLDAVEPVVGAESADSWCFLLQGLWLSGLRVGEAMALTWHQSDTLFFDFDSGNYPMLRISGRAEKGGQDRMLAVCPEFAKFVEPFKQKEGFVFSPGRVLNGRKKNYQRNVEWISIICSRIGKRAGIVVSEMNSKRKFASCHDLRRSFGERWATKVMPQTLMKLMRHESIDTTLRFYVAHDADSVCEELWKIDQKLDA